MNCAKAKETVLRKPEHFFKYYPIKCAGGKAPLQNQANLQQYFLHKQDGIADTDPVTHVSTLRRHGHTGATRPGFLGIGQREISSFMFRTFKPAGDHSIFPQAHVVPMVHFDSPPTQAVAVDLGGAIGTMPHYVLDGTGDGLMVTGELSGCCFAWVVQGTALWCIHVQPKGADPEKGTDITGTDLHTLLAKSGHFNAAPHLALQTYGANDYGTKRASVVGVRHPTGWALYAQTSSTSFKSVSSAHKIHPPPAHSL